MSFPVAVFPSNVADADLERRTLAYLGSRSHLSIRRLKVTAEGGIITLTGQLPTYYEKQVAQESVRRVAGVLRVIDAIQVGAGRIGTARVAQAPSFASEARRIELPEEVEIALACS